MIVGKEEGRGLRHGFCHWGKKYSRWKSEEKSDYNGGQLMPRKVPSAQELLINIFLKDLVTGQLLAFNY